MAKVIQTISITDVLPPGIIRDILVELKKAKEKHPCFPLDAVGRCSILSEEAGEATQVANDIVFEGLDDAEHRAKLKAEVLQTACVCVRILEAMENDER
jgi:hypothetical protein